MMKSMEVDRNGLEVLDRDECLRLLAVATLGRIGFTSGALPTVLPVNFHLDGERILVRTARGSTLEAALRNVVVAFEVDDFDPIEHAGWSVAVTGVATEVGEPTELDAFRHRARSPLGVRGRRSVDLDLDGARVRSAHPHGLAGDAAVNSPRGQTVHARSAPRDLPFQDGARAGTGPQLEPAPMRAARASMLLRPCRRGAPGSGGPIPSSTTRNTTWSVTTTSTSTASRARDGRRW